MKILFIVGRGKTERFTFPLGVAYLASILKLERHDVRVLLLAHHEEAVEQVVRKYCDTVEPEVVCLSAYTDQWLSVRTAAQISRQARPNAAIFAGGPLFISQPDLAIQDMPQIDAICLGEGEPVINAMVAAGRDPESLENIPGLVFRTPHGTIKATGKPLMVLDVDAVPFPDFAAVAYDDYFTQRYQCVSSAPHLRRYPVNPQRPGLILGARGCPYRCTFCDHAIGQKYRQRSLDNVFSEIDFQLAHYNIDALFFMDDLFSFDKNRVLEFCERIRPYGIGWMAQMRVDNVDDEMAAAMKRSNLLYLSLGIESADNSILKSMKKSTTIEQINHALKILYKNRCFMYGNIIIGDREETFVTASRSIAWVMDNPQYNISLSHIMPIPNSQLFRYAQSMGLISDPIQHNIDGCPHVNMSKMNAQEWELCAEIRKLVHHGFHMPTGQILVAERAREKEEDGRVRSVCPHCGGEQTNAFPQFYARQSTNFPITCTHCYGSYALPCHDVLDTMGIAREVTAKVRVRYEENVAYANTLFTQIRNAILPEGNS